jgi:CBS-domain-containing membrane protein
MKLFDAKFRDNKLQYIFQCLLATASLVVVQLVIGQLSNQVVVASFGASVFLVFGMPHAQSTRPRFLIGGYLIGLLVGSGFHWLRPLLRSPEVFQPAMISHVALAAGAVGVAMFTMVVTDTEHPPAAGLALGVVLSPWSWQMLLAVAVGIVVLTAIKQVMKPILRNLL